MLFGFIMGVCLTTGLALNIHLVVWAKQNYDSKCK